MDKLTTAKLAGWWESVKVWLEHALNTSYLTGAKERLTMVLFHKAQEKKRGMPSAESAGSLS